MKHVIVILMLDLKRNLTSTQSQADNIIFR